MRDTACLRQLNELDGQVVTERVHDMTDRRTAVIDHYRFDIVAADGLGGNARECFGEPFRPVQGSNNNAYEW
jgi:hypothetical protein